MLDHLKYVQKKLLLSKIFLKLRILTSSKEALLASLL
jgi:hypothetical protein